MAVGDKKKKNTGSWWPIRKLSCRIFVSGRSCNGVPYGGGRRDVDDGQDTRFLVKLFLLHISRELNDRMRDQSATEGDSRSARVSPEPGIFIHTYNLPDVSFISRSCSTPRDLILVLRVCLSPHHTDHIYGDVSVSNTYNIYTWYIYITSRALTRVRIAPPYSY